MTKIISAPTMNTIPSKKMVKDEYSSDKNKKREIDPRPEFSVSAEDFPAIKDWSVGKKYKIEVEVEMTGSRIQDYGDNKGQLTGSFKISGIMSDEDKDDKNKSEAYPKAMQKKK